MPKQSSRKSVLIDTSFLITLFDDSREHHGVAGKYYKYFIDNHIDMYLCPTVVAEFSRKDDISDILKTGNFITTIINIDDGIVAGQFAKKLKGDNRSDASRIDMYNDIQILAHTANNEIVFIATDDSSTLANYCRRLNESGDLKTQVITLEVFDESIFNGGQLTLDV
jgi:hypothetical protein